MQLHHVGYFPKRTALPPDWAHPPHVCELCSVSTCLAPAPAEWIQHWRHNDLGFFNTIADAESVVPSGAAGYSLFAYRLLPFLFSAGRQAALSLPPLTPEPLPPTYVSLGFDAVSKSLSSYFECSPLSCNGEAAKHTVNQYCLFTGAAEAAAAATQWSIEQPEPGDYYVFEVLRPKAGV
jgi:hypothetical protein